MGPTGYVQFSRHFQLTKSPDMQAYNTKGIISFEAVGGGAEKEEVGGTAYDLHAPLTHVIALLLRLAKPHAPIPITSHRRPGHAAV